jgi:alpha-galactosidase
MPQSRLGLACHALLALGLMLSPRVFALPAATPAATPPMGWNSWNWFADKVTDQDVRKAADLIVTSGMRAAGYVYVNIDDTWEGERDATGVIHPNAKFPDMKALADYVHSRGLKLGIYSSPGPLTCANFAGSYGHEQQDAATYAGWGVDYVKYDLCSFRDVLDKAGITDLDERDRRIRAAYAKMHEAIVATGRPMVYSLCQYGFDSVWTWGASVGANLWRTTGDTSTDYDRIVVIALTQIGLGRYAGPGHWNDPDILEVGNGKLTHDEDQSHMTLWAMLAAPLLAGNNLTRMSDAVRDVLTNREVIAIDQDPLGSQVRVIRQEGPVLIWSRPLADGSLAFAVFNIGTDRASLRGLQRDVLQAGAPPGAVARDLWAGRTLKSLRDLDGLTVPSHGVLLLRLKRP